MLLKLIMMLSKKLIAKKSPSSIALTESKGKNLQIMENITTELIQSNLQALTNSRKNVPRT